MDATFPQDFPGVFAGDVEVATGGIRVLDQRGGVMLRVEYDNCEQAGNLIATPRGYQIGDDLVTAMLLSLYTDAEAKPEDPVPEGTFRGGWWGDALRDERYPIGSRLWTLQFYKATRDLPQICDDMIVEALQWLIDDGVVGRFDIDVAHPTPGVLRPCIAPFKPDSLSPLFRGSWETYYAAA